MKKHLKMNKLKTYICNIFGHKWEYKTDDFHIKFTYPHRFCKRCKINQEFSPTDFKWRTFNGLYFQIIPPKINKSIKL